MNTIMLIGWVAVIGVTYQVAIWLLKKLDLL